MLVPENQSPTVAVLLPCYNEEVTIGKVVRDFKASLPQADIYVYDNNSTDRTADIAASEGAIVRKEPRQGKGNVIRAMFEDIDADVYVMADGDDTYPASKRTNDHSTTSVTVWYVVPSMACSMRTSPTS